MIIIYAILWFPTSHSTINIFDSRFSRNVIEVLGIFEFQPFLAVDLQSRLFHQTLLSYTLLLESYQSGQITTTSQQMGDRRDSWKKKSISFNKSMSRKTFCCPRKYLDKIKTDLLCIENLSFFNLISRISSKNCKKKCKNI